MHHIVWQSILYLLTYFPANLTLNLMVAHCIALVSNIKLLQIFKTLNLAHYSETLANSLQTCL